MAAGNRDAGEDVREEIIQIYSPPGGVRGGFLEWTKRMRDRETIKDKQ